MKMESLSVDVDRIPLAALDQSFAAVVLIDEEDRVLFFNRTAERLWGYAREEMLGQPAQRLLPAAARPVRGNVFSQRGTAGTSRDILIECKDGRQLWTSFALSTFDVEGQIHCMVFARDVTEDRQIRDLQQDVLEALASDMPLAAVGDFLCRRVEAIAPDVISSILLVGSDGKLCPWASPSLPAEYSNCLADIAVGEGVGSCGTAAFRAQPVLVADIETDPLWAPYKHLALPHELKACWSYPILRRDGSVAATFAFYFKERRGPDGFHERIVDACVHLCTLAIDREESRQQISRLLQFDALTGLPNRRHLHAHMDDLLAAAPHEEIACFWINLDRFEDVNETLGHAAGDQVLVEMANRLQKQLGPNEFLARPEGDSYVLVASGCGVRRASLIADRLLKIVGTPAALAGGALNLSASIGISHYPDGGGDSAALLRNAKSATSRVKEAEGNDYLFFSPELNRIARDRLLLGAALKRAIAGNELRLHYQPQLRPGHRGIHAVEALARWHDPERGEIPPARFVALAEETGEIDALSRWALRAACRQMADWRNRGVPVEKIAVNLSPLNFRDRRLPDFIRGRLAEYALSGDWLTLEITEGLVMEMTPDTLDVLNELRALGIGLSVDDFGTAFSSLSSLAHLPVTELKIDRSFIDRCTHEKRAQAIVSAVIGIGQSLDLTVVAEGVETAAQYRLLQQLGCPVLQGFLFSRPLPAEALETWLSKGFDEPPPAAA